MSNKIIKYTKDRLLSESFACDEACKVQNKRLDRLEGLLQGRIGPAEKSQLN